MRRSGRPRSVELLRARAESSTTCERCLIGASAPVAAPTEHAQWSERMAAEGERLDVVGGEILSASTLRAPWLCRDRRFRSPLVCGPVAAFGCCAASSRVAVGAAAAVPGERAAIKTRACQSHDNLRGWWRNPTRSNCR